MTISPIDAAKALTPFWMERIREFDGLEISGCKTFEREDGSTWAEQCSNGEADYWTVFGHYKTGGVDAFEDFPTEAEAQAFHDRLIKTYPHLKGQL